MQIWPILQELVDIVLLFKLWRRYFYNCGTYSRWVMSVCWEHRNATRHFFCLESNMIVATICFLSYIIFFILGLCRSGHKSYMDMQNAILPLPATVCLNLQGRGSRGDSACFALGRASNGAAAAALWMNDRAFHFANERWHREHIWKCNDLAHRCWFSGKVFFTYSKDLSSKTFFRIKEEGRPLASIFTAWHPLIRKCKAYDQSQSSTEWF